jgi:hypothetical protein
MEVAITRVLAVAILAMKLKYGWARAPRPHRGTSVAPCQAKEVPMNRPSAKTAAILLGFLLAGAPVAAQPGEREASPPSEQKRERAADESSKREEKKDEIEICKEKAHGLSGPERARFMTECLRENK